jgi:hypothetical protein
MGVNCLVVGGAFLLSDSIHVPIKVQLPASTQEWLYVPHLRISNFAINPDLNMEVRAGGSGAGVAGHGQHIARGLGPFGAVAKVPKGNFSAHPLEPRTDATPR